MKSLKLIINDLGERLYVQIMSQLLLFFSIEESLFFINLNLENINDFSSLYNSCRSQVPDIPYAKVSVVNQTNTSPVSGRDYFYCRVETERGVFRSSSVIFQGES